MLSKYRFPHSKKDGLGSAALTNNSQILVVWINQLFSFMLHVHYSLAGGSAHNNHSGTQADRGSVYFVLPNHWSRCKWPRETYIIDTHISVPKVS